MKTKQILMAGALALSMVLSGGMLTGCSNSSNTKDTKTSEVGKKNVQKLIDNIKDIYHPHAVAYSIRTKNYSSA